MIRNFAASTVTALMLVACATTPKPDVSTSPQPAAQPAQVAPPPPVGSTSSGAFDPVGSYNFSLDIQGNPISGTMLITKAADGTLGGEMSSDQGTLTFNSVILEGRKMTASGVLQNGPEVMFVMEFAGDDFTGTFSMQGANGTISGTRRKS